MFRSLNSRLLVAFAFVIVLSLAISAAGTLLLLRGRQEQSAEERVGRLAEPVTLAAALLEQANVDQAQLENAMREYAQSFDVRILLVNSGGEVVFDTGSRLSGSQIDAFNDPSQPIITRGNAQFRKATFSSEGDRLVLFAPAQESIRLQTNRLADLQATIFGLSAAGVSSAKLDGLVSGLLSDPSQPRSLPLPPLRPLIAVPEQQITSAWRDVIPQLAIAGGIALLASAVVAMLISRSVTGRLARVTRAAQEMARGNYDQRLDVRGQDEVGRLAQGFNVMAKQVSRSDRMMRDLLANVSHELKTPLTSIQGFSQALEEDAIAAPDERRQAARIINEETQRMRQLVDDLIDLSRLESGQAVMQRERIDLAGLLRVCAGRFAWQLRDADAAIQLELPALPSIEGDGRRLEQAFTNLIDNAVRHTPKGGSITVRAAAQNGAVRVAVHNTGSYIPPDELPRIFERFFQADPSRTRGKGAGLGLAIASEVVQAHRGAISASSDQQDGTEFVVTLPLASKGPPPTVFRSSTAN
jgi:signal transduction histidine kinase